MICGGARKLCFINLKWSKWYGTIMEFCALSTVNRYGNMYIELPNGSKVVTRPPRLSQAWVLGQYPSLHGAGKIANHLAKKNSSLVFLTDGNLVNLVWVVALFTWHVLSMASYFRVPVVLLTMSFRVMPKYFPQLSGYGLFPDLKEKYRCKKNNYCNNHSAIKNVTEIPPNAQKPIIRTRVLRQKLLKWA